MVHQQATVVSFADVFLLICGPFLALALVLPVVRKPVAAVAGGGH